MHYEAKDYSRLIGMDGFSNELLENHFTLYRGYVTNTNKAMDHLSEMGGGRATSYERAEVRRRLGWEWNGMRLHELYFDNLGGYESPEAEEDLARGIHRTFGSYDAWERDFKAVGSMRGIGWVVLYHDTFTDRLVNAWIDEHDEGHFAGATPLLVMDVFEHAFMLDYGLKRGDYVDAFFRNIRWTEAGRRMARPARGHDQAATAVTGSNW